MQLAADMLVAVADRLVADRGSAADRWLGSFAIVVMAGPDAMAARRDDALRRAADLLGVGARTDRFRAHLRRYGERWRRVDQYRPAPPDDYAGTAQAALFDAYVFGGGDVPLSDRQLGRILLSY